MKMFGLEITKAPAITVPGVAASAVPTYGSGWFTIVNESFAGAWQRMVQVDAPRELLAFSAVFGCVTGIASDFAKLRPRIVEEDDDDIYTEVTRATPYAAVLRKPNQYQTWYKFMEQWIVSKLLYGAAFILKERDKRGIVTGLYVLDAQMIMPLVAADGSVFYRLALDYLSGLDGPVTVPASEIIHDMMVSLWHPLVGVSPIYACGVSATQGRKIQTNSTKFFENMSRPSGMLTSPGKIDDETAARLKKEWEANFSGGNIGRVAVGGLGLEYKAMTIPAIEAQLIEQLKWTVEDVARCFHYPLYKLGGAVPVNNTIEMLNQGYYSDCLQTLIESAEALLTEGLGLPNGYYLDFDLYPLLRMDQRALVSMLGEGVSKAIFSSNEARAKLNLKPVKGGESPMLQQQNYSLEALSKRDAKADPFAKPSGGAGGGAGGGGAGGGGGGGQEPPPAPEPLPAAKVLLLSDHIKRKLLP